MRFRLIESKADQQKLIDFAGEKIATRFLDNRKLYKSPENDIYYWLKKSPEELKDFMEKHKTTNQKTKSEIDQILEMPESNDVDLIAEQDGYTIYKINTPEASVKYGLVVGGKAGWCISGGYYDGKADGGILKEARHYFEEYLDTEYEAYYFIIGHRTKYALCVQYVDGNHAIYDIWDQNDNTVGYIPDLSDIYDGNVLLYEKKEEFEISNGTLVKFNNINNVTKVAIPNSVTSIGDYAFRFCRGLKSITIPDSVTSIGDYAFCGSGLKSITIPNSVSSIGWSAFSACRNLTSIVIPDSVTSIGNSAFVNCSSLTSITIGNSVTRIGEFVFDGCSSLTSITIPESVEDIDERAFLDCTGLRNIVIPDSVTNIGDYAFEGCRSLKNITIPDNVTNIGNRAFYSCTSLKSITFKGTKSQWQRMTSNMDLGIENDECDVHCTDGDIQTGKNESYTPRVSKSHKANNATILKEQLEEFDVDNGRLIVFRHMSKVTIPDNVKIIGNGAFEQVDGVKSITIPDSVKIIENSAFWGCTDLESVTIGNGVTSIGEEAFCKCTELTNVTIGNGVTNIGDGAFAGCYSLTNITFKGTKSQWQQLMRNNKLQSNPTVHCVDGDI